MKPATVSDARREPLPPVSDQMLLAWGQAEAAAERDGSWRLPPATVDAIRSCGVLAAPVPVHLGGLGWDLPRTMAWLRDCAAHAPATALTLAMPLGNAATCRIPESAVPLNKVPDLQRGQQWIADQVARGRILAVANSEPGAAGDLANTKTTARLDGTTWRLTGLKAFATGGPDADAFLCAARTPHGVEGFFVAADAPGLRVGSDWDGFGMQTSASVLLHLDDAPAAALLGYPGCLEGANARHWSTLLFGAVFAGVGLGALRSAKESLRATPILHGRLGDALLQLEAAWGFLRDAAAADAHPLPAAAMTRAQQAKTFVAKAAIDAATLASEAAGGRGYRLHSATAKFLRDALAGPHLRPPAPAVLAKTVAGFLGDVPRDDA